MSHIDQSILKLTGPTAVYIDWANVYGWEKSLPYPISPLKLYRYLKTYPEIYALNFYFGTDTHPKAKAFLNQIKKIGFTLITKPVKYVVVNQKPKILKRKCDFDLEICMHVLLNQINYETFIFFSGDGDFEPLYQHLISLHKHVIVIYAHHHLGREIYAMKNGVYKISVDKFKKIFDKKMPQDL